VKRHQIPDTNGTQLEKFAQALALGMKPDNRCMVGAITRSICADTFTVRLLTSDYTWAAFS
jgi:hypothetical protein